MRRHDREIINIDEKIKIIDYCKHCRLGLSENGKPYIVPLNYGYRFVNGILTLFFHGAKEGRKLNIIKTNNNACFEIDCDTDLIEAEKACGYGFTFKSVIGFGEIKLIKAGPEKSEALNYIMQHQTGKAVSYTFTKEELAMTAVFKMTINEFTGKQRVIGGKRPAEQQAEAAS